MERGLSHVEYCHLRRPRRARAIHKGRRPRRDDRRGAERPPSATTRRLAGGRGRWRAAKCVYESGSPGSTCRRSSRRGVDCVVGAVSKMIKPAADRRRMNDRNDAGSSRAASVGNVVEAWVPDDGARRPATCPRPRDAREDWRSSSGCRSSSSGTDTCSARPPRPGAGRAAGPPRTGRG